MAVIINELEVMLEPVQSPPPPGGSAPVPEKPRLSPHDILTLLDREQGNGLRVLAH
ncbi:MAG: hypothetical protein ABSB35_23695 [Bryobacteraceae bacterium]|jgi:hypothetical protein